MDSQFLGIKCGEEKSRPRLHASRNEGKPLKWAYLTKTGTTSPENEVHRTYKGPALSHGTELGC